MLAVDQALNYQALSFWWNVFLTLCLVALAIYQWIRGRHQANSNDIRVLRNEIGKLIGDVEQKQHKLDNRITAVEHDLSQQPTARDIHAIYQSIGTVHADLKQVVGSLTGLQRAVDLMNQHLIERGGR